MREASPVWVVRQRLAADSARVRSLVAGALSDLPPSGPSDLTGLEGVATASLFLHSADPGTLVWVLEPTAGGTITDPSAALRRSSPLFSRGLGDLLVDDDDVLPGEGARLVVHETLPGRPSAVESRTDEMPVVCSTGGETASPPPDAVLLRPEVRPGLPGGFLGALVDLVGRLRGGRIERLFRALSEPVMEAEGMYTETLLLEAAADGRYLVWYMEFADLDEVFEAYDDTSNPVARLSEYLLGWVLTDPVAVLTPAHEPDFELLAHAVSPERSRSGAGNPR